MSNYEELIQSISDMKNSKVSLNDKQIQNFFLGCISEYLAQIADALNEIKSK